MATEPLVVDIAQETGITPAQARAALAYTLQALLLLSGAPEVQVGLGDGSFQPQKAFAAIPKAGELLDRVQQFAGISRENAEIVLTILLERLNASGRAAGVRVAS